MEKQETKILLEIEEIIKKRKTDPEQLLFMSVILQAMLDATKPETEKESEDAAVARRSAQAWFFSSVGVTAEDFITVCDIADIDPDYVKSFAFKVLRSSMKTSIYTRLESI
jgi:hypothetical protein